MNDIIIAKRDPTEKDNPNCLLWCNWDYNRFFIYVEDQDGKHIWEHMKEKTNELHT